MSFVIKQNDTKPALEAQLINSDGHPINLDMCGVMFHMKDIYGRKEINKPAIITDAENGKVKYEWEQGDTDITGIMQCEFQITFTDNSILTVPNDGYFLIRIVKELA